MDREGLLTLESEYEALAAEMARLAKEHEELSALENTLIPRIQRQSLGRTTLEDEPWLARVRKEKVDSNLDPSQASSDDDAPTTINSSSSLCTEPISADSSDEGSSPPSPAGPQMQLHQGFTSTPPVMLPVLPPKVMMRNFPIDGRRPFIASRPKNCRQSG